MKKYEPRGLKGASAYTSLILGLALASGLTAADFDWNLPHGFPVQRFPKTIR